MHLTARVQNGSEAFLGEKFVGLLTVMCGELDDDLDTALRGLQRGNVQPGSYFL